MKIDFAVEAHEPPMHARELVELAAIVSAHGPVLIQSGKEILAESVEQYWVASKVRLDRWVWRLKTFTGQLQARQRRPEWPEVRGTMEEILTSEMLTRVWTATLCAYDNQRGGNDAAGPVARSVMIGHMEARHRVLALMVRGPGIDADSALKLNRVRRRVERWTDLLIGHLTGRYPVGEFAFDPRRAKDFAEDLQHRGNLPGGRHIWSLVLASLRAAFRQGLVPQSPNSDLNTQIASSILSCFPADVFDSTGLLRSMWLMRLTNVAEDTQGLIDDLLTLEQSAAPKPISSASIRNERLWRFGE